MPRISIANPPKISQIGIFGLKKPYGNPGAGNEDLRRLSSGIKKSLRPFYCQPEKNVATFMRLFLLPFYC
jgi:hypothetical protein